MGSKQGDLWAFGEGAEGQLGLGTFADQLLQALVGGASEVFDGEAVVMVAAGRRHTICVMVKGMLWTWGNGAFSKQGHGNSEPKLRPTRLGKEMYGRSPAVMVSCRGKHTLVLTAVRLMHTHTHTYT